MTLLLTKTIDMQNKVRQSNFELLRLVCMFMILAGHAAGYLNEKDLVGTEGVLKLLLNQFCLVGVDVFVLISGWFGIRATWKGAGKLLFQILFVTLLCTLIALIFGLPLSLKKDVLPYLLCGSGYWFVVSYLILYALSPVLNAFVEKADKTTFRNVLIAWFTCAFFYGFLLDKGHYDYGFSALSFIGLYLLARYVRIYQGKLFCLNGGVNFAVYVIVTLISATMFWFGYKLFGMGFHLNHYDSPLAVIASLSLLLAFSRINLQSKTINWLASSAFSIYLVHQHSVVLPWYRSLFRGLGEMLDTITVIPIALCLLLVIGLFCIMVDKPRELIWNRFFR